MPARRGITFQRTKTWKESPDLERDAKLARIEEVLERFPDRVFVFDEFEPLGIRPTAGSCWPSRAGRSGSLRPTTTLTGCDFHGCYSVGDDTIWGVNRRKKGATNKKNKVELCFTPTYASWANPHRRPTSDR